MATEMITSVVYAERRLRKRNEFNILAVFVLVRIRTSLEKWHAILYGNDAITAHLTLVVLMQDVVKFIEKRIS